MKSALLSNVNVESIARQIGRHEVHIAQGFGVWTQELADPASATFSFQPASIFLILDGAELLRGQRGLQPLLAELDEHLAWIDRAAAHFPGIKFFVSTIDVPTRTLRPVKDERIERLIEEHWHEGIRRASAASANVYIFDLKQLIEESGRFHFYSNKRWYLGGLRFSTTGERLIAGEMERILDAQMVARKKCLLLDLDNTLWGGVVGEDGINGLQLSETGPGARYRDFQLRVRELGKMGIILGLVSKNNEADALEVFEAHEHMVLKKDDFAAIKINWSPKAENIAALAEDLDIGIDSIVFIDDNPLEREAVKSALPEITVPDFPSDTSELPSFLERVYKECFFTIESTEEDRKRTKTYLANAKRAAERTMASSIDEFLEGLRTKIFLTRAGEEDFGRAAQLTQKTNQFNLTTRRYSEQDLRTLESTRGGSVYIASVADKYGDNGKVIVGILRRATPDTAELDTFLMSCRVLGRFVEDQVLDHFVGELRRDGFSRLQVRFTPTRKNAPARAFVERLHGGRLLPSDAESGELIWEFDIAKASPVTKPAYAELVAKQLLLDEVVS
ncbi:MAG: HAD family hydrolase [Bradyrhizobium sp.]|uniref:HAD-IIIC family phosphatase n=1 Tax=Bradyrhizobium sp. TaxID=376 RepID=UPI001DAC2222|nr:HAD-IIIC family phosphatase [Bradyrhizobium sp.]MBV9559056.1 HAD family hydrolase [Bradyrhizobium sp.]